MPGEQPNAIAGRVLVVDDDEAMLRSVARALRSEGFGEAVLCQDPREAEACVSAPDIGVVLLDLVMPHLSGEALLARLMATAPDTPVIIVTATDHVDTAVRCIKAGAFDFLVKPVDYSRLIADVTRALQQRSLRLENRELRARMVSPGPARPELFAAFTTRAPVMLGLFRYIEAIGPSPEPALVVGETGVGKELIAAAIHAASGRPGDMVSVNVAGIDDSAFADTLFGHVRGAFTGADRDREGLIARAGEGTLFLDEIGDLGVEMQTKLLRLLQEREYFPLGTDSCRRSRCRIVAATNRDLRMRMRDGRFREDLYYRLQSHLLRVPPLRERMGDVPILIDRFLRESAEALGRPAPTPPKELFVHLSAYGFPGNVRELRAMVLDAVTRHDRGVLALQAFHEHMDRATFQSAAGAPAPRSAGSVGVSFGEVLPTLEEATGALIEAALKRADGNQAVAARLLGISRRTVNRHLRSRE